MPVTRTTSGRFSVGLPLFAVHFGYNAEGRSHLIFRKPLVWNNDVPDTITFKRLTVTEHHRVFNEWADKKGEPDCDGYLLKDDNGQEWSNQYPYASYGQTSDEGNRRFTMHCREEGKLRAMIDNEPNTIFQCHLLSDILESMEKGIKELSEVDPASQYAKHAQEKLPLLKALYERVIKQFEETYPAYKVSVTWEQLVEGSKLRWPRARFYQVLRLDQARDLAPEELFTTVIHDRRLEVELGRGDRLCIEDSSGAYYIDGEQRSVKHVKVFFLEDTGEEQDGKKCYHVCATEYFPRNEVEQAVACFHARLHDKIPSRSMQWGKSIEMIYRLGLPLSYPTAEEPTN